jgi:Domain of unknown function (DUF4177)
MNTLWEYEAFVMQVATEGFVVRPELNVPEFKSRLNDLGRMGWELVAVFDVNMLQGGSKQVVATFKRPVSSATPPMI